MILGVMKGFFAGISAIFQEKTQNNGKNQPKSTYVLFVRCCLNFLKANANKISGSISTTSKDYFVHYQDLQGLGMTGSLALPTLIALCSVATGKPTLSSLAVSGDISISGTLMRVDNLADTLQVCLDSGAKKVLIPMTSAADLPSVPTDLLAGFTVIFYNNAEDAVFKALGAE